MVLLQSHVIIIRTDNGTEFKNQVLKVYFDSVGISHQMYSIRTPQQNGVVERQNRTTAPLFTVVYRKDIGKLGAKGCFKHMTGNLKLLINFVWKFMGTIHFRNDHVAAILGFGMSSSIPPTSGITISITSELTSSESRGLDNTKTRRPQPRSNTKNDRVPSVNHDVCLRNYMNGKTSRGKKQKANVSIKEKQKKHPPKVKKTNKVGFIKRLATPKPSKSR
nr:ribonuclease H-like domain-containing protein [Tanacetum cinerariifolium]